jgi:hypothetical protein
LPDVIEADLIGNITGVSDEYFFIDSQDNVLIKIDGSGIYTTDVRDKDNNTLSTAV